MWLEVLGSSVIQERKIDESEKDGPAGLMAVESSSNALTEKIFMICLHVKWLLSTPSPVPPLLEGENNLR